MKRLTVLAFLASCGGVTNKGSEPLTPPPPCVPISQTDSHPVAIEWGALKNIDTPVSGTLDGTAVSQLNAGGLKGARFEMSFNPANVKSGNETRDTRIASFFFRVGQFSEATFKGTIDWIDGDNARRRRIATDNHFRPFNDERSSYSASSKRYSQE